MRCRGWRSDRPTDGSDYFSHTTRGHDDSDFNLRASRGPNNASHCLLSGTRLTSGRPSNASCATGQRGPHLIRGSSATDADLRGYWLSATQALHHLHSLSPFLKSVQASLADPHWRAAMGEEYTTLMSNGTWDLVPHPRGTNVVTSKWMFKHKFKAYGTLERYKAR
jgi:hypothetical protein